MADTVAANHGACANEAHRLLEIQVAYLESENARLSKDERAHYCQVKLTEDELSKRDADLGDLRLHNDEKGQLIARHEEKIEHLEERNHEKDLQNVHLAQSLEMEKEMTKWALAELRRLDGSLHGAIKNVEAFSGSDANGFKHADEAAHPQGDQQAHIRQQSPDDSQQETLGRPSPELLPSSPLRSVNSHSMQAQKSPKAKTHKRPAFNLDDHASTGTRKMPRRQSKEQPNKYSPKDYFDGLLGKDRTL